jgi:hypothetical protein
MIFGRPLMFSLGAQPYDLSQVARSSGREPERNMSWITALSGRSDTIDPSEEDTVINGAAYRPRPFPPAAAHREAANSAAAHAEAGRRRDVWHVLEVRRRVLAAMHAR